MLENLDGTLVKYTPVIEIDASTGEPGYDQFQAALLARLQPL